MFTKVKAFAKRAKTKLMAVGASAALAISTMAMTAFASEGTQVDVAGSVEQNLNIFTKVIDWFFNLVLNNSVLLIFFVGGLVFLGIGVVKAVIRAVKH